MSQKIYIFAGVQGSGKGTQGKIISKKLNLTHISTGDLLREATGDFRKEIDSYIVEGNMVPDELILSVLEKRIQNPDCYNGIILDGYPRNIEQAKTLDSKLNVEKLIEIQISDEEALKRLLGRYHCSKCKEGYNIRTTPKPTIYGFCNKCDGKLIQRKDDISPTAIKKRITEYHELTEPILNHYSKQTIEIDGYRMVKKVTKNILEKLN